MTKKKKRFVLVGFLIVMTCAAFSLSVGSMKKRNEINFSMTKTTKMTKMTVGGDEKSTLEVTGAESIPEVKTDMEIYSEQAEEILAQMSLEEKVYQMFIVTPEQLTEAKEVTIAEDITRDSLQKYPVGGIIYLNNNLLDKEQTSEMLHNSQEYALEITGLPLFLCIDEEGGRVARVSNNPSYGLEKIKSMESVESEKEAYEIGAVIGKYLSELGFNVDFAPDADVLTNSENKVIGDRSFGDDPILVTEYAAAYSDGLHSYGVLSTFKHFPGHGATIDDTHQGLAYTNKTLEELKQAELLPFMAAQSEGVDMVMISHISVPSILGNNMPCTLSHYMITEVLKGELGYEGLVVTDAMNMGAVTSIYDNNLAVVSAVKAGADLILMPVDFRMASNAVVTAVESGEIEIETVDESVKKIIVKKLAFTGITEE